MLQTMAYWPAVMFLMVKVRVSPGLRLGSPVSPMLVSSETLLAPVLTGTGGSPPSVTGSLSNGTLVLRTTASWSMVPVFFTTKVTSPAGAGGGDTVMLIGPARPAGSDTVTFTVVLVVVVTGADGIFTPPSTVFAPVAVEVELA